MIHIIVLFILGLVILVGGLMALRRSPPDTAENDGFIDDLRDLIALRSLSFRNATRLFVDSDYRVLLADPRLSPIARELRKDRRRIALQWLRALQQDVFGLWRLRRLLTKYGAVQSTAEEVAALLNALQILWIILLLRLLVFLFGPFSFANGASNVRCYADNFSSLCARAVGRLPKGKWVEFVNEWRGMREAAG